MEINIDTVYQKVLALANKEQRGYITPQEFNLLADQAQMEIFEQYFYDQNQADRNLKNSTELSNVDEILDEKISIHKKLGTITMSGNVGTLPGDVYRLGTVFLASSQIELEQLTEEEALFLNLSPLARPTIDFPAYVRTGHDKIRTYPTMPSGVVCNYIKKPNTPEWTYVVVNEKALWNPNTNTRHFQLHHSDETELVYKILSLAGIVIAKPGLGTYADTQITGQKTQEKQ